MTTTTQRSVRAHLQRILYHSWRNCGEPVWHDAILLGRTAVNASLIHTGNLRRDSEIPSGRAVIRWALATDVLESKLDTDGRVIVRVLADWPEAYEQDRAFRDSEYHRRHAEAAS